MDLFMHILIYLYRAFLFTTGSYLPLIPPNMRIEGSLEKSYRLLLGRTWNASGENMQQHRAVATQNMKYQW